MQEFGCLQGFTHGYASPSYTLVLCWLWWVAVVVLMILFGWAWSLAPVLALLLPVACPAPPCAWLPTLRALHLLGAWLAPCCSWSCLSNHVALALAIGFNWWGEFPPNAQLMSRENLCRGVGAVCCGAGAMVCWCWCAGRLGFLVDQFCTYSTILYYPLGSEGLTPL
jgi:hypothetical protein